jgi:flagellin-like protein
MKRKGISPLIASVLLIAFVMAIASIFATFATNVVDQPRQETVERSQQLTQCSNAIVEVEEGNVSGVTLRQSQGDSPVANLSVIFQFNDSTAPIQNYTQIDTRRGITEVNSGISADTTGTSLSSVTVSIVDQDEPGCSAGPEIEQEFPINTP